MSPDYLCLWFTVIMVLCVVSTQTAVVPISSSLSTQSGQQLFQRNEEILTEMDTSMTPLTDDKNKQNAKSIFLHLRGQVGRYRRKAIRSQERRWPGGIIPYQVQSDVFTDAEMGKITQAMEEWSNHTCLKFRAAETRDVNQVVFANGFDCSSFVGMKGGIQNISLAPGCRSKRTILHEIGHAIGFIHEHQRPDRDDHVTIVSENIRSDVVERNFKKENTSVINTYNIPYDYNSIMHYSRKRMTKNGRATIVTSDDKYQKVIGQGKNLSDLDIKLANLMYQCDSIVELGKNVRNQHTTDAEIRDILKVLNEPLVCHVTHVD